MRKGFRKAAVIGLSAALAMTSLAGCSKKEEKFDTTATALTVNGTEVSAGVVKFMTHYMQAATESFYNMYFGTGSMNMAIDQSGVTLGAMMKDQNVASLTQMVLAEQHMEEYGVALTDDEKAAITAAATAFIEENDAEVLEKMGATQADIERYLELNTIQTKMGPLMSADVDTEVSDEEAAQRRIQYTLIAAETEGESEESTEGETAEGTEAETVAETAVETETETVAETEAETVAETEAETAAETEAETVAETEAETAAETEAETVAETEAETTVETEEETEAETAVVEENTAAKTNSADETEAETETETEDPAMIAAMEEAYVKAEQVIELIKGGEDFEAAVKSVDEDLPVNELTFDSENTVVAAALIEASEGVADDTLVEVPVEGSTGYYVVKVITQLDREATDAKKEEIVEERKTERIAELFAEWEEAAEIKKEDAVLSEIVFDFSLTLETEASTEAESGSEAGTEASTEAESETEA